MFRSLFVICAWFVFCMPLQAQTNQYKFAHININHGLSHNQVNCILKDRKGFLWAGTLSGLSRFDGYTVKVFRSDPKDSTSLPGNSVTNLFETPDGKIAVTASFALSLYNPGKEKFETNLSGFYERYKIPPGMINDIVKDHAGNYFFVHATSGLVRYNARKNTSLAIRHSSNSNTISTDQVTSLVEDSHGNFWMIHATGTLEYVSVNDAGHNVLYRNDYLKDMYPGTSSAYRMQIDNDGDLWLFAMNSNIGAYYFDHQKKTFKHLYREAADAKLSVNIVRGIVQDNKGLIWIGTDHGGINVVDKKDFSVRYIVHREADEKSLAQNSINTLYKDDQGIIWVATYKKGLSYSHENIIRFPLYKQYLMDDTSLPYDDVNRFVEDDIGNLWIGTNGAGLIYFDRKSETFKQYKNNPKDPNSLSSDVIVSLCIDHEKKLWIGTYYGGLNSFDGKKFTRYNHRTEDPQSLSDENVWEVFEDSQQRLWVGTLGGGLDLFDRRTRTFSHYLPGELNSVQSRYINAITEDKEGNIWIGTDNGVDVLKRESSRFVHYGNEKNNGSTLSSNSVLEIREDSRGRVWIGTHGGLNVFNKDTKSFQSFTDADGLPHNSVLTILEDNEGSVWLGTPNGLSNMTIVEDSAGTVKGKFKNFDEEDGLQGKQYNENAAYRTRQGELIFGGANGFNIFKPEQLGMNKNKPEVILSDFQLFNKSIKADELVDGKVLLTKSITEAPPIVLPSNKNVFSIEFAALNFFHPEKNEYKYRLKGFNADWLSADSKSRRVTFTNLDPGDYEFHVIAANNDGVWNNEGARINITVLPPFWKTKTAMVLYILAVIGGLLITRKLIQQREQMKFAIQQERQEALRMHELDMMKIKFFTNVSHEFRTPLTLILTPLEKILKQAENEAQKNQFELIQRNARRLLNLVNQLLDFRKMEVQELRFTPSEGDVIKFITEVVYSFSDLSEKKDIKLEFHSSLNTLETIFDQDKLEKILFNLLSNAFKFTPEHGQVTVDVALVDLDGKKSLQIKVIDTGIGISEDKLERIFDRFFQNELPKSVVNQGSGIGLSITKEFVKIHGGTITVNSELEKGSCFTVLLPVHEIMSHAVSHSAETVLLPEIPEDEITAVYMPVMENRKPLILLVEDNEDFRFYLKDNLKLSYEIIEAKNGQAGWKKALHYFPDLIVSDIMMPEMNGIELCAKIKSDTRVSHIPIILLTARTSEEQRLEGFEIGADDYINKPFNFEILESRIRNLIAQRQKLQKTISQASGVKASELNITSLDEKLIQNAIKFVEENVSNADFSVEDLSRELGISRAHFYKKILALTGKSPLEFIRTIRLQQAAQLLEKSQLTVAEVAYKVGFNNPKYFAKYFKEAYHILPSAYAAGKRRVL